MDYSDIDYESCEKIKTKDKQTLSGWLLDAVDLVRRQSSQMYLLKEIIECFKTEALRQRKGDRATGPVAGAKGRTTKVA